MIRPARLLGLSLALNLLLGLALWHTSASTRQFYAARWRSPAPASAVPEPSPERLGTPPAVDTTYSQDRLTKIQPAKAYHGERGAALVHWQASARQALAEALHYHPRPFGGQVRLVERTSLPGVIREKLYLRSAEGFWLPAYWLRPTGLSGRRPALLALPGHDGIDPAGRGAIAIAGHDQPENYMGAFGLHLAEAGYPVLAVDVAGIGELRPMGYAALNNQGLLIDRPLRGLMLEETHEAIDYLLSRPEVDPRRIGTVGLSLGGELALDAAALDPRIAFTAVSGIYGSYRDDDGESQASLYVPGLYTQLDVPDVAGLVAPRPMLIQAGLTDTAVPVAHVAERVAQVERVYRAAGVDRGVALKFHPGGHVMAIDQVREWLQQVAPIR